MKVNLIYIFKKYSIFLILVTLTNLQGCKTIGSTKNPDTLSESDFYNSRPKIIIDSPIVRLPYTLRWDGDKSVKTYEVQSANDPLFTISRNSWTTKESFLQLKNLNSDVVYIRVRSHFDNDVSRWSEVLLLTLNGDDVTLSWSRI